jgi:hypothetical protein
MVEASSLNFQAISNPRKRVFLAAFAELGTVKAAIEIAGVCRASVTKWVQIDADFRAAYEEAKAHALDVLEQEARRRAVNGTERPVFFKGGRCGSIREFSDTLLIFLMKAGDPIRFGDPRWSGGATINVLNAQDLVREFHQPRVIDSTPIASASTPPLLCAATEGSEGGNGAAGNNGSGNGHIDAN